MALVFQSESVRQGKQRKDSTNQTWMLAKEQCDSALSSVEWKAVMSSRGTDVGSGRSRPAEKEALAIAS